MESEIPSPHDRCAQRQGGTSRPILPIPNPTPAAHRDGGGYTNAKIRHIGGIPPELRHSSRSICNHSLETRTNRVKSRDDLSCALDMWGYGEGTTWNLPWPSWSPPRELFSWARQMFLRLRQRRGGGRE
jgi:hypothetical protein